MTALKIFCSYAPEDKDMMEKFHAHLRVLEIQHISIWYAQKALPGTEWERERDNQLRSAHLILFLVSADFISSHEYDKTVMPAMERYNKGEVRIIPIILRPVDWQTAPFGHLLPLPDGGKPVIDWKTVDHAFLAIVSEITRVLSDEKIRLSMPLGKDDLSSPIASEPVYTSHDAPTQLDRIIRDFTLLRQQIASYARLHAPQGFSLASCENQYNKLYGDTLVFLAIYLPETVAEDAEGFVEHVYKKAIEALRKRDTLPVSLARMFIPHLAKFEHIAEQIDACNAILEGYKQRYFSVPKSSS